MFYRYIFMYHVIISGPRLHQPDFHTTFYQLQNILNIVNNDFLKINHLKSNETSIRSTKNEKIRTEGN